MSLPAPRWSLRRDRPFFNQASRRRFNHFTLFYLPSETFHSSVIVPKTVSAKAVIRNRLKRVSRAAIRLWQSSTQLAMTVVVVIWPNAIHLDSVKLQAEITQALNSLPK